MAFRDFKYLNQTTRVRTLEAKMLTRQRMVDLINAKSLDEATLQMETYGWVTPDFSSYEAMDKTIDEDRRRNLKEYMFYAPDKREVTIFKIKYDYHNIKAILKAEAQGKDYNSMLSYCGCITPQRMIAILKEENYAAVSPPMKRAIEAARESLAHNPDPLVVDMILDKACYEEMYQLSKDSLGDTNEKYLWNYMSLLIDSLNLSAAIRIRKRGLPFDYMRQAYIFGGWVSVDRFLTELTPDVLENMFANTRLLPAAKVAGQVLRGKADLADLDKACDDAIVGFTRTTKHLPLGKPTLPSYIAAKEYEYKNVRIIFSGRLAGLKPEVIEERLRDTYV